MKRIKKSNKPSAVAKVDQTVRRFFLALSCVAALGGWAAQEDRVDPRVRTWVYPKRIVWQTPAPEKGYDKRFEISNAEALLKRKWGQISEGSWWANATNNACIAKKGYGLNPGILLDFGRELHGGVQLGFGSGTTPGVKIRLRFGESVGEAMSELGEKGSTNDHAMRDIELAISKHGAIEFGNTGFRFLRIDLVTTGTVGLELARAVSVMRPMKELGTFRSSDARLNTVFETAKRTVHLCCQEYLWDGIKRDRLVWMGDTHPEVKTILTVFGDQPVVTDSLDYMMSAIDPKKKQWMNGIPSYTFCYLRNEYERYLASGDRERIRAHRTYLADTVRLALTAMTPEGAWKADGFAFLDWPSQHDKAGTLAGLQGHAACGFRDAAVLMDVAGETALAAECRVAVEKLRAQQPRPAPGACKQAAAMLALGGVRDAGEMYRDCLCVGGIRGFSTFYGYYMLEAMCEAGKRQEALDTVRDYWGAMNDVGATSYWENFDIAWTNGCTRLDELPVAGKKDVHGDYGEFCYPGYRHSLCHGWAGGPAAWCIENILGLRIAEPGGAKVSFRPFLGNLAWAEGSLALPNGRCVKVKVSKDPQGRLVKSVQVPPGVTVMDADRLAHDP